jgi:TPR repeat protein
VGQYNLALMLETGRGVAENKTEAVNWFHRSADQGVSASHLRLGIAYAEGEGIDQNVTAACGWFLLAVANGVEGAADRVAAIQESMTPEQIAESQKLAAAYQERFAGGL